MAWIESHTVLGRHRKLIEMAKELRIKPVYLMGHFHSLWHIALEQQEDGDLTSWSDDFIAESSAFDGESNQWVSLLRQFGWLDGNLIHDWLDYAGGYLAAKYHNSNHERLVKIWAKHGRQYGSRRQEGGKKEALSIADNLTLPDLTLPNNIPPPGAFDAVWAAYPKKIGMKVALTHFNASVKTMTDFLDIQKALDHYRKSERVRNGYIQNGSTWFNNWRDWINYTEEPNHARSNSSGGAYIGAQAAPGKYSSVTENRKDTDPHQNGQ